MANDRQYDFRSQREGWQINIEAKEVLAACTAKREHHEDRLSHWREQELLAEKAIRETGITFRSTPRGGHAQIHQYAVSRGDEQPVGLSRMSNTQMRQEVHIDEEKEKDLLDAQQKVDQHLALTRQYIQWEKLLTLMPPTQRIALTIADVEFFDMATAVKFKIPERELETANS